MMFLYREIKITMQEQLKTAALKFIFQTLIIRANFFNSEGRTLDIRDEFISSDYNEQIIFFKGILNRWREAANQDTDSPSKRLSGIISETLLEMDCVLARKLLQQSLLLPCAMSYLKPLSARWTWRELKLQYGCLDFEQFSLVAQVIWILKNIGLDVELKHDPCARFYFNVSAKSAHEPFYGLTAADKSAYAIALELLIASSNQTGLEEALQLVTVDINRAQDIISRLADESILDLAVHSDTLVFEMSQALDLEAIRINLKNYYRKGLKLERLFYPKPLNLDEHFINLSIVPEKSIEDLVSMHVSRTVEKTSTLYDDYLYGAKEHTLRPEDIFNLKPKPIKKKLVFSSDAEQEASLKSPTTELSSPALAKYATSASLLDAGYNAAKYTKTLITGVAGVGKTTLSQALMLLWAQGKTAGHFLWVMRIPLRNLNLKQYSNTELTVYAFILAEGLQMLDEWDDSKKDQLIEHLKSLEISGRLLLILDGYDEVLEPLVGKSKVIFEQLLRFNNVLITSRPYGIARLEDSYSFRANSELQITGFTDANVKQYVNKFFADIRYKEQNGPERLLSFLQANPSISVIAKVPINLELICSVWHKGYIDKQDFSVTKLYENVIIALCKRYLNKFHEFLPATLKSMTAHSVLNQCQLALNLIDYLGLNAALNTEYTFKLDKAIRYLCQQQGKLKDDVIIGQQEQLGIIRPVSTLSDSGTASYYFNHLTFRDFFAARYLAGCICQHLSIAQPVVTHRWQQPQNVSLVDFIAQHAANANYEIIWWFTAGILSDAEHYDALNWLLTTLSSVESEQVPLFNTTLARLLIRCLDEARKSFQQLVQGESLLNFLARWCSARLELAKSSDGARASFWSAFKLSHWLFEQQPIQAVFKARLESELEDVNQVLQVLRTIGHVPATLIEPILAALEKFWLRDERGHLLIEHASVLSLQATLLSDKVRACLQDGVLTQEQQILYSLIQAHATNPFLYSSNRKAKNTDQSVLHFLYNCLLDPTVATASKQLIVNNIQHSKIEEQFQLARLDDYCRLNQDLSALNKQLNGFLVQKLLSSHSRFSSDSKIATLLNKDLEPQLVATLLRGLEQSFFISVDSIERYIVFKDLSLAKKDEARLSISLIRLLQQGIEVIRCARIIAIMVRLTQDKPENLMFAIISSPEIVQDFAQRLKVLDISVGDITSQVATMFDDLFKPLSMEAIKRSVALNRQKPQKLSYLLRHLYRVTIYDQGLDKAYADTVIAITCDNLKTALMCSNEDKQLLRNLITSYYYISSYACNILFNKLVEIIQIPDIDLSIKLNALSLSLSFPAIYQAQIEQLLQDMRESQEEALRYLVEAYLVIKAHYEPEKKRREISFNRLIGYKLRMNRLANISTLSQNFLQALAQGLNVNYATHYNADSLVCLLTDYLEALEKQQGESNWVAELCDSEQVYRNYKAYLKQKYSNLEPILERVFSSRQTYQSYVQDDVESQPAKLESITDQFSAWSAAIDAQIICQVLKLKLVVTTLDANGLAVSWRLFDEHGVHVVYSAGDGTSVQLATRDNVSFTQAKKVNVNLKGRELLKDSKPSLSSYEITLKGEFRNKALADTLMQLLNNLTSAYHDDMLRFLKTSKGLIKSFLQNSKPATEEPVIKELTFSDTMDKDLVQALVQKSSNTLLLQAYLANPCRPKILLSIVVTRHIKDYNQNMYLAADKKCLVYYESDERKSLSIPADQRLSLAVDIKAVIEQLTGEKPVSLQYGANEIGKNTKSKTFSAESMINSELDVNRDSWVLGVFMRTAGKNHNHAFFMLEGMTEDGLRFVKRYDFIQHQTNKRYADIDSLEDYEDNDVEAAAFSHQFDRVKGYTATDTLLAMPLTQEVVVRLEELIEADKSKAGTPALKYQFFGPDSFVGASQSHRGHNCYSWIVNILKRVENQRLSKKVDEKLAEGRIKRYLITHPKAEEGLKNYLNSCMSTTVSPWIFLSVMVLIMASFIGYLLLHKMDSSTYPGPRPQP
jgi:hypothetical protein